MRLVVCALVALLAAPVFASEDPNGLPKAVPNKDEVQKEREKVVCTRETPVGSLIPVRRCTTKVARDIERDDAQNMLNKPIPGNGSN